MHPSGFTAVGVWLLAAAPCARGVVTGLPSTPRPLSLPRTPADTLHTRPVRGAVQQFKRLAVGYRRASQAHYLPMASVQSGLLRGAADAVGQGLQHPGVIDLQHTAVIGVMGLLVSGFGGAMWLSHLENKLGSETAPSAVLRKTLTDYTCWAPFANSCYLFLVPLLLGADLDAATHALQAGFASVMLLEASIFMPYNLLAFNSIPAPLRPPAGSLLAAIFTIGLGVITSAV